VVDKRQNEKAISEVRAGYEVAQKVTEQKKATEVAATMQVAKATTA